MTEKESLVESVGLREIDPKSLKKNPENPRMLFDEADLAILRESIKESGILVPLLVYVRKRDGNYVILDGERRWRCALLLGLETVPANVIAEPSHITNILTMFNIHNVRSQWEPMPTALKMEVLIRLLKIKNPRTPENMKKLAQLTGLSPTGVEHSLRLLSYPKRYQDLMLAADKEERVRADFFVEVHPVLNLIEKSVPEISKEFSRNELTDKLLGKYRSGVISSARQFRRFADIIRAMKKGVPRDEVVPRLKALIETPEINIMETYIGATKTFYEIMHFESVASEFRHYLSTIQPKHLAENEKLLHMLNELKHLVEILLAKAQKIKSQMR